MDSTSSDKHDVGRYFSSAGRLHSVFPDFEERPQQVSMALAVQQAMEDQERLLVEAGTGTGKTLAYLVPACRDPERTIVVSTATKALQEQIMNKDLLLLEETLGRDVNATILKGRRNYLCQRQLKLAQGTKWTNSEQADMKMVLDWTRRTDTGDFAEISGVSEKSRIWSRLSSGSEDCYGQHCPYSKECWANMARSKASRAQLIIVNHHLFFADISLREQGVKGPLPTADFVIFDEAHRLEDAATSFFSENLHPRLTKRLLSRLTDIRSKAQSLGHFRERIRNINRRSLDFASDLKKSLGKMSGNIALEDLSKKQLALIDRHLDEMFTMISDARDKLIASKDDFGKGDYQVLEKQITSLVDTLDWVQQTKHQAAHETGSVVYVFNPSGSRGLPSITCAPVDIGLVFEEVLYPRIPSCIFVSATLAVEDSMYYTRQRLALGPEDCRELVLDSPFDHTQQTMLYIPQDIPDPRSTDFLPKASEYIKDMIDITGGRAFVLCTSYRAMDYLYKKLKDKLQYRALVQGELQKDELLRHFCAEPSVLFATTSFWEGIDVAHDDLSLVIIDKLPFAVPTDPLERARAQLLSSWGANAFSEYVIPRTALALKQGYGRLIRRKTDRGIVAILDNRLLTKGYGRVMLRTLPNSPLTSSLDELREWF